ncbi:hypothetical protein L6452_01106 [Arctium lappa]|uniref:Uncharacterized protein n=1 Tax=Arctium lappa TaxID=4217 RepID=A0ACB9FF83_ARCLA|nr:hypothetical protein L6452_01106 [Arctium lappa]
MTGDSLLFWISGEDNDPENGSGWRGSPEKMGLRGGFTKMGRRRREGEGVLRFHGIGCGVEVGCREK